MSKSDGLSALELFKVGKERSLEYGATGTTTVADQVHGPQDQLLFPKCLLPT